MKALRSALLIIDMQNGVYNYVAKRQKRKLLGGVIELEKAARTREIPIFWITYVSNPAKPLPKEWSAEYFPKSKNVKIIPQLRPKKGDFFSKREGYNAFSDKRLEKQLHLLGIKQLFICGANTEQCVLSTATHASDLGYTVLVIDEAVGTCAPSLHKPALKIINDNIGKVVSLKEATGLME